MSRLYITHGLHQPKAIWHLIEVSFDCLRLPCDTFRVAESRPALITKVQMDSVARRRLAGPIVRHDGSWRFVIRLHVKKEVVVHVASHRRVQSTQDHAGSPRMWLIDGFYWAASNQPLPAVACCAMAFGGFGQVLLPPPGAICPGWSGCV